MITYFYWAAVITLVLATLYVLGFKTEKWPTAVSIAGIFLVVGWAYYFFYLQQIFVKHWGGVMNISVPEGQHHLNATWKDDNLWIENYDPKTNKCLFTEYSRGNVLEGKVIIKNCNPLIPR
jgi:hypothetical protein